MSADPPEGFAPFEGQGPFLEFIGPVLARDGGEPDGLRRRFL